MTTTFLEGSATRTWGGHTAPLLRRVARPLPADPRRTASELDRAPSADQPAGLGRTGRGLSERAPRHRQLHAAGGPEDLFARTLRGRAVVRRGDGADGPGGRPRGPNPAGQSARRSQLGRPQPHPHDGDGMGRRLRPLPAADAQDARTAAEPREQQALELHQPGDRHGRADAAAA